MVEEEMIEDPKSVQDIRDVLSNYHHQQSRLSRAISSITNGQFDAKDILHGLKTIEQNANSVGDYLTTKIPTKYYNERRALDSTKAYEVLFLPELLEMILATIADILNVYRACKDTRAIIQASLKIQIKLFLRPTGYRKRGQTELTPGPAADLSWVKFEQASPEHLQPFFIFQHKEGESDSRLPPVASLWKHMYISQPEVWHAWIRVCCTNCGDLSPPPAKDENDTSLENAIVYSENHRLTFGELYDRADELSAASTVVRFAIILWTRPAISNLKLSTTIKMTDH